VDDANAYTTRGDAPVRELGTYVLVVIGLSRRRPPTNSTWGRFWRGCWKLADGRRARYRTLKDTLTDRGKREGAI